MTKLYPEILEVIATLDQVIITEGRKKVLSPLVSYIQNKLDKGLVPNLNFICTHNSRRSHLAQIWAKTLAEHFAIAVNCFSGGIEVTEFNKRAVTTLKNSGFRIEGPGGPNPKYTIHYADDQGPINSFSKLYDDPVNNVEAFAAVMTCSHADENCPFIPGSEARISVQYEDPKDFDGTPEESAMYDERSRQIAAEMYYVFSQIRTGK